MNNADEQVFFLIRTVCFFFFFLLDQFRVKHKPVDRLIVKTIKSHALITNLMRNNK